MAVKIDTRRLDRLIDGLPRRAAALMEEASRELRDETKSVITEMGAVDTGGMRASTMHRVNLTGEEVSGLVEVKARSGAGFPYPVAVHEGHHTRGGGRYVPGRPFLRVATERRRRLVLAKFARLFKE